jgi:hypothetical protein
MSYPKQRLWIAVILTFIVPPWTDSQTSVVTAAPITTTGSSTNSLIASPQALMTGFTASVLNLELRAWTDDPGKCSQIRSDLSVTLHAALMKATIAVGEAPS